MKDFSLVLGTKDKNKFDTFFNSLFTMQTSFEVLIADCSEEQFLVKQKIDYVYSYIKKAKNICMYGFYVYPEYPPLGYVKGYNKLFKETVGKYVVWLNDDCELLPGWDKIAYDFMEKNPDCIGAICFADPQPPYRVSIHAGIRYANFGIIKKELGDGLGWFDERLQMYGADTAISLTALQKGLLTLPIPQCRLIHHRHIQGNEEIHQKDLEIFNQIYQPVIEELQKKYPAQSWFIDED